MFLKLCWSDNVQCWPPVLKFIQNEICSFGDEICRRIDITFPIWVKVVEFMQLASEFFIWTECISYLSSSFQPKFHYLIGSEFSVRSLPMYFVLLAYIFCMLRDVRRQGFLINAFVLGSICGCKRLFSLMNNTKLRTRILFTKPFLGCVLSKKQKLNMRIYPNNFITLIWTTHNDYRTDVFRSLSDHQCPTFMRLSVTTVLYRFAISERQTDAGMFLCKLKCAVKAF
jgi:hypothetical protein